MGWSSSRRGLAGSAEQQQQNQVKHMLQAYRQRCLSTFLLYPTFRSSSVIMTMSAPRALTGAAVRSSSLSGAQARPRKTIRQPAFLRLWQTDATRKALLSRLSRDDLICFRLVCHDFGVRAAPVLFAQLTITFRSTSFTRPVRMAALERIGHHVQTLTFRMPHGPETFLAPLLDSKSGKERSFAYLPRSQGHAVFIDQDRPRRRRRRGVSDLLIKQYGPLFHAASNMASFIRAFSAMSSMCHLIISCPGLLPSQRYRRSVVDYALISVRVAVERAPLTRLSTLSLLPVHAGAMLYLRPGLGFAVSPKSARRWAQIKCLLIHMDGDGFGAAGELTDQLKLLRDYLRRLSPQLERLSFRWKDGLGPCPLVWEEVCAGAAETPTLRPSCLYLPRLRHLELASTSMHASHVSALIGRHRHTLRECDFDDVRLSSGDWDGALSVLTTLSGSERWKGDASRGRRRPR